MKLDEQILITTDIRSKSQLILEKKNIQLNKNVDLAPVETILLFKKSFEKFLKIGFIIMFLVCSNSFKRQPNF